MIIRYADEESWVNHRDHRNTASAVLDAAYPYSRDILFFKDHFKDKDVSSHNTPEFLLADFYDHKDLIHIDVTEQFNKKVAAISANASQFSQDRAKDMASFFAPEIDGRRLESFRYVVAD